MTTLARPAARPALTWPRRSALAGTGVLLRAALRRDRRRLAVWVAALGGLTVYSTVALGTVYPTAADRQARAAVVSTPAGTLLSGPGYGTDGDYPLGAMTANELTLSVLVAVSVMSVLLVVRHTRAEEESGSAELLLTGSVGRRAPLVTALTVAGVADAAVAVVVAAGLVGSGLAVPDSLALALGVGLAGLVFGAVAAVTAQVVSTARAATGSALALLLLAVLVRGVGDVQRRGGSALSWCSPLAWVQQTRAFVDLRWAPLLPLVALGGLLVAVAVVLSGRRDVGAGLLAPRCGPAAGSRWLAGPVALLARLQRGSLLGWAAGLLVLGATFGSLTDSVTAMVAGNPRLAQALGAAGADRLTDGYTAATASYVALCVTGWAVGSVLRLRGEEGSGRLELLLSTGVGRRHVAGAGLAVTTAGVVLLLLAAGLGSGLAAAAATGDGVGTGTAAVLVQLPAALVVAALTAALLVVSARLAPLAWAFFVWCLLVTLFGPVLGLPDAVARLTPFGWVPAVPASDLAVVPLAGLTAVAVVLAVLALAGYRRRDLAP